MIPRKLRLPSLAAGALRPLPRPSPSLIWQTSPNHKEHQQYQPEEQCDLYQELHVASLKRAPPIPGVPLPQREGQAWSQHCPGGNKPRPAPALPALSVLWPSSRPSRPSYKAGVTQHLNTYERITQANTCEHTLQTQKHHPISKVKI